MCQGRGQGRVYHNINNQQNRCGGGYQKKISRNICSNNWHFQCILQAEVNTRPVQGRIIMNVKGKLVGIIMAIDHNYMERT